MAGLRFEVKGLRFAHASRCLAHSGATVASSAKGCRYQSPSRASVPSLVVTCKGLVQRSNPRRGVDRRLGSKLTL